jgi:hypothetical protein
MRAFSRWLSASPSKQWLTLQAFALLIVMKFRLYFFPVQSLKFLGPAVPAPPSTNERTDPNYPSEAAWAVRAVSKRLLRSANCLPEALVVRQLLLQKGFPADLKIGVSKGPGGELTAHAWVLSNGAVVIGGSAFGLDQYVKMGVHN